MREETSLERAIREYEKDPEFVLEGMLWDLNDQIAGAMEKQKISRAELAKRLGTSRSYVTKLLRGTTNVTLQSLARVAVALGSEVNITLSAAMEPVQVRIRTTAAGRRLHVLHGWQGRPDRVTADDISASGIPQFDVDSDPGEREDVLIQFPPTSSAGTDFNKDREQYA